MRASILLRRCPLAVLILGTLMAAEPKDSNAKSPRSRTFRFVYSAAVTGLEPGKAARIWVPVPSSTEEQDVEIVAKELPAEAELAREPKQANRILHFNSPAGPEGKVTFSLTYQVTRREVRADLEKQPKDGEPLADYLGPNALVPVGGKPLTLLKDKKLPDDPLAKARVLYDIVNSHMRYSKVGTGWGNGDSVWACDSGYGNCSDFHSLFMSLARAQKIPVKFEIGFPLPRERGSGEIAYYHCWAKFRAAGHDWIPVDISEANKNPAMRDYYFGNLTADRVTFSTGRDIDLVPKQDGKPLNFFVFPYVEVDGKPYPDEKVQRKFSFKDIGATTPK